MFPHQPLRAFAPSREPSPADFTVVARGMMAALLLASLLAGCSGCTEQEETTPTDPFAGRMVEVLLPAGLDLASTWEILAAEWSAQTGAEFAIREYPADEPAALAAAIDEGAGDAASLIVFPASWKAALAADERLAPIPEAQQAPEALDWLDLFSGLRENVAESDRRPAVLPVSSPVLVLYYRRDLLEAAGREPPRTWSEYRTLVAEMDQWAPGLTAVEPWSPAFRATMFLARAAAHAKHPENFSFCFDVQSGAPLIDGPGFVRALNDIQETLPLLDPKVHELDPAPCRRALFTGRAALAISYEAAALEPPAPFPGGVTEISAPTEPTRLEGAAFGFVRLPGAAEVYNHSTQQWDQAKTEGNFAPLTGFAGLFAGVADTGDEAARLPAWNLLAVLVRDQLATAFPGGLKTPTRASDRSRPGEWVTLQLTAAEAGEYLDAVSTSLRDRQLAAELPLVAHGRYRAALTESLTPALESGLAPEAALQQAADRFRELNQELGPAKIRDGYRRTFGLSPLDRP